LLRSASCDLAVVISSSVGGAHEPPWPSPSSHARPGHRWSHLPPLPRLGWTPTRWARAEDDRVLQATRPHMLPQVRTESGRQDLSLLTFELLSGDDPPVAVTPQPNATQPHQPRIFALARRPAGDIRLGGIAPQPHLLRSPALTSRAQPARGEWPVITPKGLMPGTGRESAFVLGAQRLLMISMMRRRPIPDQRRRRRPAAHDGPVQLTPSGVMPPVRSGGGLLVYPARPPAARSAVTRGEDP